MTTWFKKLALLLVVFSVSSFAQEDLTKSLTGLLNEAGKAYVGPASSAFGADINSGWFHRAPDAKILGLDVEISIVGMGTMFEDKNKEFDVNAPFRFSESQALDVIKQNPSTAGLSASQQQALATKLAEQEVSMRVFGPTIIGKKSEKVKVQYGSIAIPGTPYSVTPNTYTTQANGVLDGLSALPMAAPQITVGTVFGTSAAFRALPSIELDKELGKLQYFGFGIMHNPAVWLPVPLPVDFAVSFYTQKLDVGDYFKASASIFGLYASKKFGVGMLNITPYAGITTESSTLDVSYNATFIQGQAPVPVKFSLEGENSSRITLGASFKLVFLNLSADYSFAKYSSFSASLNFGF